MKFQHFNDGWVVKHLGETEPGLPVSVPDDAMLREPRSASSMGGLNVSWFEGRDYSYTKAFTISEKELAGCLVLEFEGVYRKAEVWLNGRKAAFRPYGYTNFYCESEGNKDRPTAPPGSRRGCLLFVGGLLQNRELLRPGRLTGEKLPKLLAGSVDARERCEAFSGHRQPGVLHWQALLQTACFPQESRGLQASAS